jgi:hypothetical protein
MIYHLTQWAYCLKHYVLMCVLSSGPERLPNSIQCIILSLLSYLLIGLMLVDTQRGYLTIVGQISIELGLLSVVAYGGLRLRKKLPRFYKTLSALVGANLIMTAISIPIYKLFMDSSITSGSLTQIEINLAMALIFWNLAVMALIFKRAFDIGTLASAMISFNYFVLHQLMMVLIY